MALDDLSLVSKVAGSGRYYHFSKLWITQHNNRTLYYLHNDHLGGMALTTSNADNATLQSYAYGRRRGGTGSPHLQAAHRLAH